MGITANEIPSQEELLKIFKYDNGKLFWKIDKQVGKLNAKVGDEVKWYLAGKKGYPRIKLSGKGIILSRLIYKLVHGELPINLVRNLSNHRIS